MTSVRINKYLADKAIASRRKADELVSKGLVYINGKQAKLGDVVLPGATVEVRVKHARTYTYVLLNKPIGVLTHGGTRTEPDALSLLPKALQAKKLAPLGRLDKESHGLLLLSDDGRATKLLIGENSHVEKEYMVKTKDVIKDGFCRKLANGVYIEGYKTKPAKVTLINDHLFSIVLTEGKKHQIRRMVAALNTQVKDLKRVRIGALKLGALKSGAHRVLTPSELSMLLPALY